MYSFPRIPWPVRRVEHVGTHHQSQRERAKPKMAAWVQVASVETPDSSVCVMVGTVHGRCG